MNESRTDRATVSSTRETSSMDPTEDTERETALFEAAQQLASVGGWAYDVRSETLYVTAEVDRIYGREPEETVTLATIIERFHPSDQPAVRAALDTAINDGEAFEREWRLQPPDREQRWVRVYGEPQQENGTVVRIRGAIEDITPEKRHKERLNSLFETNRDLLEGETAEAVAEVAVEAAQEVLGLSISGIHLYDEAADALVPTAVTDAAVELFGEPPTFERGEAIAWQVFETGESQIYDDVRTADNVYDADTAVRSECSLPLGDHGVFLAGSPDSGAFDDRTVSLARILAANVESALEQLDRQQQLRQQNDRLEEFASIVSHDLRNPLSVAKAGIEVARHERNASSTGSDGGSGDDGDADSGSDTLDRVERAHDRMETLIDDLLTLAQTGQDLDTSAVETLSLSSAVDHAWQAVETDAADHTLVDDGSVAADPSRLQQLLENLFRNSVEHNEDTVSVRVGTLPEGFYVEDDGPGIAPSNRETVFEAGHSTRDDGTGLGLRIVRTVADAHGWDVTLTESDDGGARFEFTGVES